MLPFALAVYAAASVLAFALYALDKHCATREARRIPESTLHLVELLGGFPGAFVAQRLLRHKTRKLRYQIVFWLIVAAHSCGWLLWLRARAS